MKKETPVFTAAAWTYDTNIYEVNLRQYTPEGTFKAFAAHLPRLKDMGVEVLWFMPIHPIGFKDRHGALGSYYSIRDYTDTNPEFGTVADFKELVAGAHKLGLKVIIDVVANHSSNDHPWIQSNPEFYVYNDDGSLLHPHGWDDVSQLNYDEKGVWEAMIGAMQFWITECDVDGFRCDMAHLVRLDFWIEARKRLDTVKENLFWLAECEEPGYHKVFDATYTWKWMHGSHDFYQRRINLIQLLEILYSSDVEFPKTAFRLYFTSNHDENSWNGTEYEKYGDAARLFAVFSCLWNGIPLVYTGQEMPNWKRLKFFDKDYIGWTGKYELHDFYKTLLELRKQHPSLRAGDVNVSTSIVSSLEDTGVFSFLRKSDDDSVLVILNCTSEGSHFRINGVVGTYKNVFDGSVIHFSGETDFFLPAWGFLIFEQKDS
ncbi:MAG: alpha amylase C-terminal domain-containing protein [Chitinophagaceae bacterium]|nr:alpha amylase C-terminal domain-containing protein [Chitinophagaceae bacterium]